MNAYYDKIRQNISSHCMAEEKSALASLNWMKVILELTEFVGKEDVGQL
jgi:hypothetical protein